MEATVSEKMKVVKCPDELAPLFGEAERTMASFFDRVERNPERGDIRISGVRYLFMRTESLAIELHEELRKTFGDMGARQIRYKLGKSCGARDAKLFHEHFGLADPVAKLALGPVHFAHVGWANVDISPESKPAADDSYFLAYEHPFSFEASSYIDRGIKTTYPVCLMNAGYSTGWCEVSFGLDLRAEEVTCQARGDDTCRFVMAPTKSFDKALKAFKDERGLK